MTNRPHFLVRGNALSFLLAMLSGALLSALLMGAGAYLYRSGRGGSGVQLAQFQGSIKVPSPESGNAIVWAVRKVGPAAVAIETRTGGGGSDLLRGMRELFNGPPESESRGSGLIIDGTNGYVLTNAHVVKDAGLIVCKLNNGARLRGAVVGADTRSDIAVVKVEAGAWPAGGGDLPEAPLGTSRNLAIGEWAIAIGNPYGNQHTVTVGVISAIRDEGIDAPQGQRLDHVIQTDAAINPGNSGGPLCNIKGEVIGINTAIIPYAQGIGFAIPIDNAKRIADALIKGRHIEHAWIGISLPVPTPGVTQTEPLPKKGVLITRVEKNSPAAAAGVKDNDIILEIDHKAMNTASGVISAISAHKPGDMVTLVVQRGGREVKLLKVRVSDMPKAIREKL